MWHNVEKPKLYRRRFIPDETVYLKDDEIIFIDENVIVTKWNVLKPRKDFIRGYSCFFLNEGYKVSKFINASNECIYTYCDIVKTNFNHDTNTYVFEDLLVDVVIYPDGMVKVLDLAEISEALDKQLITIEMAKEALELTDSLLNTIYLGKFDIYADVLEKYLGEQNVK